MKNWLLICLIFPLTLSAQVWVENNAVWHYDYWNMGQGGFYKVTHVGDTLLAGHISKRFNMEKHQFHIYTGNPFANDTIIYAGVQQFNPKYTYQSNDSVYYWDQDQYRLLFNFGAQIGDSWLVSSHPGNFGCSDTSIVEVVNTGIENINGTDYRFIDLQSSDTSTWTLNGHFNERFGGYSYTFTAEHECNGVVEWDILTFKCFEDDSFSLYNPSGEDCEYYLTHLDVSELETIDLVLYPNPTSGTVTIEGGLINKVEIVGLDGRVIETVIEVNGLNAFSTANLEPGSYIVQLYSQNGQITSQELIKR
jgi:Secretion system C-terminal sorting domain